MAAWRPRNAGRGACRRAQDHLSHDKWHLSSSDWSRDLELVTWFLRLRLTFKILVVWSGVIVDLCRMQGYYVDLGMRVVELSKMSPFVAL